MARKWNGRAVARALVLATLWLAVSGRPLAQQSQSVSDEDPLFLYGWGKITRLQYLYSAGPYVSNCFLRIRSDGSVDCEEDQNERNLLEFRAVALKTIAIKDVSSVRYLCMSADGKIYGLGNRDRRRLRASETQARLLVVPHRTRRARMPALPKVSRGLRTCKLRGDRMRIQ